MQIREADSKPFEIIPMDFRAYEAAPGISVIVLPDSPIFTHVAVSNDCLREIGLKKQDVIGKGHFEVFPQNTNQSINAGEKDILASFEAVMRDREPHEIPAHRYD